MADKSITLKRNNAGTIDNLYPTTTWDQIKSDTIPTTFTPAAHTLDVHSNVSISSPVSGQVLKYNGTNWVNDTDATGGSSYTHPTHPGDDISIDTGPLTGATVISDLDFNITSDTLGHITDANATVSTRSLTAADVGAAASSHTHTDDQISFAGSPTLSYTSSTYLAVNQGGTLNFSGLNFGGSSSNYLSEAGTWEAVPAAGTAWTLIKSGTTIIDLVNSATDTLITVDTGQAVVGGLYAMEVNYDNYSTTSYTSRLVLFRAGSVLSQLGGLALPVYGASTFLYFMAFNIEAYSTNQFAIDDALRYTLDGDPTVNDGTVNTELYIGKIWRIGDFDY